MTIVYTPHACDTPSPFENRSYKKTPVFASGTIWRCDECGRYWRFRARKEYDYPNIKMGLRYRCIWRLVQSWHLISVFRILTAEARGPEWKLGASNRPELTY